MKMDKRKKWLAKEMVGYCERLPSGIAVLGGVLRSTSDWEAVYENFISYMKKGRDDRGNKLFGALASSYYSLPNHLKPCFLYMGHFPSDCDISVERIINLWVAEGLVFAKEGRDEETLEDVAYGYLCELEQRYMIQGCRIMEENATRFARDDSKRIKIKRDSLGRIESWCIHNLMQELCLLEGVKEGVFQHTSPNVDGVLTFLAKQRSRRIAIYLDNAAVSTAHDEYPSYRSILCFSGTTPGQNRMDQSVIEAIIENFKSLRVLDLQEVFPFIVPENIGKLINLRFLNLSSAYIGKLDESIGNLKNLLTLHLKTNDPAREMPDVIWKLESLRHLYLPRSFGAHTTQLKLANLSNLQTLVNFPADIADFKHLITLKSLRKLSICIKADSAMAKFNNFFQVLQVVFPSLRSLSIVTWKEVTNS